MMKCDEIQEWLGVYWDLPKHDPNKLAVDEHIARCECCTTEFVIWQESTELIKSAAGAEVIAESRTPISKSVMKRIYEDESWRVPVADRMYAISFKFRRNVTAMIAFCLALFIFSFVYTLTHQQNNENVAVAPDSSIFGRIGDPVVVAGAGAAPPKQDSMNVRAMPSAVASLKGFNEPFMYQVGPINTYKDYMLFLSLIGLTSTLLIMNWLSRTRS